ncbi:MAG: V-type ATP synthase subunit F [Tenericutes bacterium ADurb.Bin024]|nr:MAG: V-type ATP synthase subunit F [Tenericutes bacterium ADurb.Bin024]
MDELVLFSNKSEAILFKAIGFLVHVVNDEEEITEILKELPKDVKVIAYDTTFTTFFEHYHKNQKQLYPLYLPLPFDTNDEGKAINEMKESIRKSIGIDLL